MKWRVGKETPVVKWSIKTVSMELALQVINMTVCIMAVILIFTGELIIRIRLEH